MSENMKKFPLYLPMTTYMQLKEIADYKGLPVTRVMVAILNGYLRSRKVRQTRNGNSISSC